MSPISSSSRIQESEPTHIPDPNLTYDVFLSSESGNAGSKSYTSCLCACLQKAGISVFWDDGSLSGEDHISPSQLQAIQNSRISVVVLSEGYTDSRKCLEVLEQIIEWRRIAGQFVMPVLLGVSPYDLFYQLRESAFNGLTERIADKDKVEGWKLAFARIAKIPSHRWVGACSGYDFHVEVCHKRDWSDNDNDIKRHVELARGLLDRTDLFVAQYPVGVHRASLIPQSIDPKPTGVTVQGIWGMVGIGKTTLAKSIYNRDGGKFEGRSFLPNIRHVWEQETRRLHLQERVLFDICKVPQIKIDSIETGKRTLKKMLCDKRILLVLDNVNKLEQLNALCGSREWFGPGSMIIITTRDKGLLRSVGVDHVHKMKEMDESESFELFNRCAFSQATSRLTFDQLSRNAVDHAGGLPLALEVLGTKVSIAVNMPSVSDRDIKSPHPILNKLLKRCVDDLNDIEKDIFLDIAYFSVGVDREGVIKTLNAFGDFAKDGIKALEDQCLITVDEMNKLGMHVLLRDMGRKIIHQQMQVKPGSWIYDVYVSFGEDTRSTFTSYLYTSLANAKVNFFKDNEEIIRRYRLSVSLLQAIEKSKISVIVLSKYYAGSRWCLQELEKIMECHKTIGQVVVPVFFGVDSFAVCNQTGMFGEAFQELLKTFSVESDKEKSWRAALHEVGGTAGIVITDFRNYSEDVKNVVEHVIHFLDMSVVEQPVGVEARVQDVIPLLNKSKDVLLLGIWGMGGSGKTTIAKAIYNIFGRKYESKSFLQNISEVWKQDNGQVCLQEKLLSDINERTKVKIVDNESGKKILIERLRCERMLLVLDDVDKLEQLNALCGSREWFGSGSIIIITTRDKSLLNEVGVDHVYKMKEMDESESVMLFSWHAFKQLSPRDDFIELSRDVVAYCGGLPLALEELGRELCGKKKTEWKSLLDRYKRVPHPMIHKALKRSFESLSDDKVKNIFLDIALFFIGWDQNEAIQKLNGFRDLAATSVHVLVERSLITVDEMNKLGMHVLLRDMAREILRQQSRLQIGPRIYDVFLSFSKDTPSSFTSCLIGSMEKAGISVYGDDDSRSRDDQISPSLLQIIQKSRIFIVVLSTGYARSRRCLQVLEQITTCCRIAGQFVLRVLSNVSSPDLLFQEGEFGKDFDDLTKRISDKDKVESWKIALARISRFLSSNSFYYGSNVADIKKIVKRTEDLLNTRNLFVVEFPVGVESHVRNATQLVTHRKSKDVLLLGIWGMVGIGKTTIAKAIYNKYGGEFEGRSFLPNIREVWELDKRHVYLQERLLSDVYKLPKIKIDSTKIGKKMLKEMLSHKKILLVLDDVNKLEQLNVLCESREWFGSGSMIIITTRDRSLLRMHGVDHVYSMKEMDENESCQLFRNYTFSRHSTNVVAYAGGLPLALEVLSCKVSRGWEADKPIKSPHPVVQKVLKRCINDLNNIEKSIFLDIASFLVGMDREEVVQALNTFGNLAEKGIRALEDQCLVTFDEMNKLRMHVLLQEIGREIVREQLQEKPQPWIYDVFLSFRGEDTRATFTSHLNTYLANAGIHVFMDDDKITRGDRISISLLQAIKKSRTFVVVLSRRYANSRWCLQELEKIMVCCETYGRVVLPVFYGVDPSAVRKQKDEFGEAFQDLLKRFSVESDKEKSWRRALRRIGGIAGIVIKDSRNESEDINRIVENITGLLENTGLFVAQHPVGVKSRVQHVIKQLNYQQSKDVQLLGISGIGGIGKTTIAKAIYNQIRCDFEACCFLSDIREKWEQFTSQVDLQEQLLSDVCKTSKTSKEKITNIDSGKIKLKERLCHKGILLVLDDVDKLDQLKALCWSREWFGPRSRIIITTRDEGLLRVLKVDHISRMSEMDNNESVEHFSWHAFKQASPKEGFVELSRDVVAYCKGLPLALEVIGSLLFDKEVEEWQNVLKKLKTIPNHQVQKKLRISFDSLSDDTEKEIFLDIAFFFIGMDQNDVIQILDEENYPAVGIANLIDRSLVTIDNNNKLRMHDLLRDMGREIVRKESPKKPGKRSRLWLQNDVLKVLQEHTGTKAVEGLSLKLAKNKTVCLKTEGFNKMHRLRLLQLAGVQPDRFFVYLPNDLRWLYWDGCPFNYIPLSFQASLVAIELESSCLESSCFEPMWRATQIPEKLKVLNLSHSRQLTQIPDMSNLPNLEKLLLKDCPSLSAISDTIGDLEKILLIDLEDCTSLSNLPRSFYKLKSLETLIISGCSMIDKLEEDIEQMKSLTTLIANKTKMKEVPFSIVRSKSIRYISMCGYEGFSRDVFPSLIWSWMSPANILSFSSLVQTCASSEFVSSDAPKLRGPHSNRKQGVKRILDILDATYCKELEAKATASQVSNIKRSGIILDFPSQFHISRSAKSLLLEVGMKSQVTSILRERIIQKLTTSEPDDCWLPSDNYSLTFNCEGSPVIFEVPHVNGGKLGTMMLSIVYSSCPGIIISECLQNVLITVYTKSSTTQVYERERLTYSKDVDWQSVISKLEPGYKVKIHVVSRYGFIVKKTSACLIYDAPVDQNMEHCQANDMAIVKNLTVSSGDDVATKKNVIMFSAAGEENRQKGRQQQGQNKAVQSLKKRGDAKDPIVVKKEQQQEDIPVEEPEKIEELERRKSKRKATTQGFGVSPKPPKSREAISICANNSIPFVSTKASMKPKKSKAPKPIAHVQESPHQVLQKKTHVTSPLPAIEDPTQDSKLISTIDGAPIDTFTHDPIISDPVEKNHPLATDSTLPMFCDPFFCEPIIESNTKVINDALAQTLKELDDDDIFVELEKALGKGSISTVSSTKNPSTELGSKTIDIPAVKLLLECYDIIEGKDLKSVGTDEDLMGKLTEKLTKLVPLRSQLPFAFKDTATKLERLYKDILDHFGPTSQVLNQHHSLVEAKTEILEDLSSLKKRKLDLAQSTTKAKIGLDEVIKKRQKLEEELNLLVKKENELNSSKHQGMVALGELKQDLAVKLAENEKISAELQEVEAAAKKAEATQQALSKQLEDVKQSLKIAKA